MKAWMAHASAALAMLSVPSHANPTSDPTAAERIRSIDVGHCVVREDQNTVIRMLSSEADAETQKSFMEIIGKCARSGSEIIPNIVMGAAAEKVIDAKNIDVGALSFSAPLPDRISRVKTNKLFLCAISANPSSLVEMLNTIVDSAEERQSIESFRRLLIGCDAKQGAAITPMNIRASAARAALAVAMRAG